MARWKRTVNVWPQFRDPALDFPARRDVVVARLRNSGWPAANLDVAELVDELAETTNEAEFNEVWAAIYEQANADRTWIDTRGPAR